MSSLVKIFAAAGLAMAALICMAPRAVAADQTLAAAAEKNDVEAVRGLLQKGGDVNRAHADGMTALHWAVLHDNEQLVRLVLKAGAQVNSVNRYGVSPLSLACLNGSATVVELLLDAGADPQATSPGGETPLMTASRTGRLAPVTKLLAHGAKVNAREHKGQTALMWAAAEGHVPVVDALLDAGADFETSLPSGFTPLFFAVREGRTETALRLLKAGLDVNAPMQKQAGGQGAAKLPRKAPNPLILAVENGHFETALALVKAGADPNAQPAGYGALHAISWVRKPIRGDGNPPPLGSGKLTALQFVKELVARGADVNLRLAAGASGFADFTTTRSTPLVLAARTGDMPLVSLLLELGADPTLTNADNSTTLLAAAGLGDLGSGDEAAGTESEAIAMVERLLKLGLDVNAVDDNGETAMHGAAYQNWPRLVAFLAAKGANVKVWDRKNRWGWTPLLIARGYRKGNFRPDVATIEAIERAMREAGVTPPAANKDVVANQQAWDKKKPEPAKAAKEQPGQDKPPAAGLPRAEPAEMGLDPNHLRQVDDLIAQGLAEKKMPGCVLCVGRRGKIVWLKAYGQRQIEPTPLPMTTDTVFDLASISKPVGTATSIMLLVERGQLRLGDKVAAIIPEFAAEQKDTITVQDLLLHTSGLLPDNALADYEQGPAEAVRRICALKLQAPTGSRFIYSDVNFILLGEIVRRVSGQTLAEFTQTHLFQRLEMRETGYLPGESLRARAAPTEQRDGKWIQGEVHDPRAFKLGGVAGHAGLFSTAEDLAIYAQMLLDQGRYGDRQILSPATIATMTRGYRVPGGLRGLGWDKRTGFSLNRGELLSDSAFGHGGFTGTVLWIDPDLELFYIFLSNRVHPQGKGLVNPLAGRIGSVIAASIRDTKASVPQRAPVLAGIDVLQRDGFRQLKDRRIGLITNHTGRNQSGVSTVRLLREAPQVQLVALFGPEHGFEGKLDVAKVPDGQDQASGLKVFSLYGETRRPTPAMLEGIDTLVFDIQDIGTRYYTYLSTMGEAMTAAAEHNRKFVVLDRPNPINGRDVAGPLLDVGRESFTGFHRLPVRHGMTLGELARLLRDERKLNVDLEVIACEGWHREDFWDATGLTWVNPSPNMRSLTQALLYPGIGLLEATNLSVGRGTDAPFEQVGAPWLEGRRLAGALNDRRLPGVTFVPIEFEPTSSKFAQQKCGGVNIVVTDRKAFEPVRVGLAIAVELRRQFPAQWETKALDHLLANHKTYQAIVDGRSLEEVEATSLDGVAGFLRRRAAFLLYE